CRASSCWASRAWPRRRRPPLLPWAPSLRAVRPTESTRSAAGERAPEPLGRRDNRTEARRRRSRWRAEIRGGPVAGLLAPVGGLLVGVGTAQEGRLAACACEER